MKRVLSAALALALSAVLFSGCAGIAESGSEAAPAVDVFYMLSEEEWNSGNLIDCESHTLSSDDDMLAETIALLFAQPASSRLVSPYPPGTRPLSYEYENGSLTLFLSSEYGLLGGMDATVADACIVFTLCALDSVYSVSICAENGRSVYNLTSSSIITDNISSNPYEKVIKLYFPQEDGRYLVSEERMLTIGQDSLLVRLVAEELLNGPRNAHLRSAVPEGTSLLGIALENGVCTLNLSRAFVDSMPESALAERMAVYSIVNSLTSVSEVESVRFLIEGNGVPYCRSIPLDGEFTYLPDIVGPVDYDNAETDATLYVFSDSSGKLTEVPARIKDDVYQTQSFLVLEALASANAGAGTTPPLPAGTRILSAVVINGICRVNFSNDFVRVSTAQSLRSAYAVAATLIELEGIGDVQIYINGTHYTFGVESFSEGLLPEMYLP